MTDEIRRAAALLRAGGLVAFPTETVYGLGAHALDEAAVRKIFAAKGRPLTSPLIVHVRSVAMARELAAEWPEQATLLAERFWPGPLTLVLPKQPHVPDVVTAGLPSVGLRMPRQPLAQALLLEANLPVAAPSANRFTEVSPTTAQHVRDSLGDRVDLILDGGPCEVGIESTVVSLVGAPRLLRPGSVTRAELEAVIGPLDDPPVKADGPHESPGLHHRHYSPRTPLSWVAPDEPLPQGRGIYLHHSHGRSGVERRLLPNDPGAYAAALYATLREVDAAGWEWIAVEPPPLTAEWEAVRDRLRRAAG